MVDTPIKTYPRAPITEAVIELRMQSEVDMKEQEKIIHRLKKDYPHMKPLNEIKFNVNAPQTGGGAPPTGGGVTVRTQWQGFRLTSDDQTKIVIVMPLSVVSARLAPYQGWDDFFNQARAVWRAWKHSIKYSPVARIGVRYINRIDIPTSGRQHIRLEDYLTFYPKSPEGDELPIYSYFIQVMLPTHNSLWTSSITSALLPSPLLEHTSLLLDIDVFRTKEIPVKDDDLWTVIGEARDIKNFIFQRCIAPQSERLFE